MPTSLAAGAAATLGDRHGPVASGMERAQHREAVPLSERSGCRGHVDGADDGGGIAADAARLQEVFG